METETQKSEDIFVVSALVIFVGLLVAFYWLGDKGVTIHDNFPQHAKGALPWAPDYGGAPTE